MESLEAGGRDNRKRPPFPRRRRTPGSSRRSSTTSRRCRRCRTCCAPASTAAKQMRAPRSTGNTIFGVSGCVMKPGPYELPLGTPLREIIFEHAGGLRPGRTLRLVIPGGVSMPVPP